MFIFIGINILYFQKSQVDKEDYGYACEPYDRGGDELVLSWSMPWGRLRLIFDFDVFSVRFALALLSSR